MDSQWWHKRYFKQYNHDTSSYVTFSSTAEANTAFAFGPAFNVTKTETLEDSGQTLVVLYKFNSEAEQTAFKEAVDASWIDGTHWTGDTYKNNPLRAGNPNWESVDPQQVIVLENRHVKSEWLNPDGSVSVTTTFDY